MVGPKRSWSEKLMSKRKSPTKYAADTSLFKPEPPTDERLVKALFAGREAQLERGYQTLVNQCDVNGKRSKSFDKRPWVIHGESRSGKSHLARRILAELRANPKRLKFLVPAREKIEAILVMADLFRQLLGHFRCLTQDQRLPQTVADLPDVRLVDQLIERMEMFLDEAQSATMTREQGAETTLEIGGEISGLLAKLLGKYQAKEASKETRQIVLKSPTAQTLAELCGVMVEALFQHKLITHLLVLVDDVDLLDYSSDSSEKARVQRALLTDALCLLHAQPGIDVLLTARSWFVYSGKELTTLVDLTESLMSSEELVRIHDNQIRQFAAKAGIERFLTSEALLQFAREMQELNGLPGVFLQHLHTAFERFKDEPELAERNYEWFLNVFRQLFIRLRSRCGPAATALSQCLRTGRLEINCERDNPFIRTAFDNLFVFQSYHNERCYFTSPLIRNILRIDELPEGKEAVL
jgi:hypothetical protein